MSDDRGSATVSGAAVLAVLVLLVVVGAKVGSAVVARHRVTGAADLAALAAAARLPEGEQEACDQARRVAGRMDTQVVQCMVSGWEVRITVTAVTPFGPTSATSRAGPTEDQAVWSTTSGRLSTVSGLTSGSRHAER